MSALPGAGWAEPKCCVVCDREDCEDAAHSGVAPAKEKDAPPPDGVERLCAPRSSLSDDRTYFRRADLPLMNRGDAAAGTWIFHGDESRRRRGCDVDIPWRQVA